MRVLPALSALLCAASVSMAAGENAWARLASLPSDGVDLRYQSIPTPEGWQVRLKNAGARSLHFELCLGSVPDGTGIAQRFHLDPGARAVLALPSQPPLLRLRQVRSGEDEGEFLLP